MYGLSLTGRPAFCFVFCIQFIILALLLSCSLPVVNQIRGHIAGLFPPSPLRYVPSFSSREYFSIFLPSSTRVQLYLHRYPVATIVGTLSSGSVFCIFAKNKVKISPRWESNSRTNAIYNAALTPSSTIEVHQIFFWGSSI